MSEGERPRARVCMVGSANTDLVSRVPRLPRQGECLTGSAFFVGFGGKGANQAVAAARLGGAVSVVARVGRDLFGAAYRAHFAEEGIDTRFLIEDPDRPSGTASILVEEPTGLNTIAFVPGANGALSADDVERAAEAITGADVLLCQLETPLAATLAAFRIARASGRTRTVLNTAPVPVPPEPLPGELFAATDVLISNEEESAWLAGAPVDTVEEARAAAAAIAARWGVTSILTLGARGVVWAEPGVGPGAGPGTAAGWVAARQVQPVDTTGAGDAFVGALAVLLGEGLPLALAVERAAGVATLSVLRPGTQGSFPTRAEAAAQLGW